jgi:hypothetical protein
MKLSKMVPTLLCSAIFITMFVITTYPRLNASEFDEKTILTFSAPVEVPGKVLPAGTYVFKLLDSVSSRDIVQIFDKNESRLYSTILAVPNYRLQPTDKPVVWFAERPSGSPPAIEAWFYPGRDYGEEFVYPKRQATEIAGQTHRNVLSMPAELESNTTQSTNSAQDPKVTEMKNADVKAMNPQGQEEGLETVVIVHR